MGSFSVSCGVTRLTITSGDECVFIPLITKGIYEAKERSQYPVLTRKPYTQMEAASMLIHTDELFEPAGFPIYGSYNDYGSIEDIVHDANTAAIEKKYGMTIEKFVEMATDGRRSPYDTYSAFCERFYEYPDDIDFGVPMEDFLKHIGFVNNANEKVVIETEKEAFKVFWREDGAKQKPWEYRDYERGRFLEDYQRRTGIYLGLKDIELFKEMSSLGGMFVLKEVYEFYSQNHTPKDAINIEEFEINELLLIKNGFEKKVTDKYQEVYVCGDIEYNATDRKLNGKTNYYLSDFIKVCKKYNKDIDLSEYGGFDHIDWEKQYFLEVGIKKALRTLGMELRLLEGMEIEENDIETILSKSHTENIKMAIYTMSEAYTLRTYHMLADTYAKELLRGNLVDEYFNFVRFKRAMYLTNVMWQPSFCGPQCGCRLAETKLAYITQAIVNKREKELADDLENEYKTEDPLRDFKKYEC